MISAIQAGLLSSEQRAALHHCQCCAYLLSCALQVAAGVEGCWARAAGQQRLQDAASALLSCPGCLRCLSTCGHPSASGGASAESGAHALLFLTPTCCCCCCSCTVAGAAASVGGCWVEAGGICRCGSLQHCIHGLLVGAAVDAGGGVEVHRSSMFGQVLWEGTAVAFSLGTAVTFSLGHYQGLTIMPTAFEAVMAYSEVCCDVRSIICQVQVSGFLVDWAASHSLAVSLC